MYWNEDPEETEEPTEEININMRCIEMRYRNAFINTVNRLTLTWDVLKCK